MFRASQVASLDSNVGRTGVQRGAATLTATLTSSGVPLAGKIVAFQVKGHLVGGAITNDK